MATLRLCVWWGYLYTVWRLAWSMWSLLLVGLVYLLAGCAGFLWGCSLHGVRRGMSGVPCRVGCVRCGVVATVRCSCGVQQGVVAGLFKEGPSGGVPGFPGGLGFPVCPWGPCPWWPLVRVVGWRCGGVVPFSRGEWALPAQGVECVVVSTYLWLQGGDCVGGVALSRWPGLSL